MSGNKISPSEVQGEAKIAGRVDGTESGIHESSTTVLSGMVQRGGGESVDATPNPMNTRVPSSKRLVDESSVDERGTVKRLKLVNSDTTTFDSSYTKVQVQITNSQHQDASPRLESQLSKHLDNGSVPAAPEIPVAAIASSGEAISSTASPAVDSTSTSENLSPSVVSPLQNENGDSIAIGSSSSQSRITTVSLEAKAEQCEESATATAKISEGPSEVQHPRPSSPPLKSTKMSHLKRKYTGELEYMLREFRKLERQLLGAKGNVLEESAGSRERREKLHSFIIHLEGTIREIEVGCQLESQGKCTTLVGAENKDSNEIEEQAKKIVADSVALTKLTKEKEEEENVQKLEEHILANLLPVKVRLKKQLAAQQGASQNPAGMPARRGSLVPSTTVTTGTTFAAAAEQRRKAEAARLAATSASTPASPTATTPQVTAASAASKSDAQFSNTLTGGGSSLTQKLLGSTSGSGQAETRGASSNTSESNTSSVEKQSSAPINGQNLPSATPKASSNDVVAAKTATTVSKPQVVGTKAPPTPVPVASSATAALKAASAAQKTSAETSSSASPPLQSINAVNGSQPPVHPAAPSDLLDDDCDDLSFTEEERKRMRKRKRKKKQRRERSDHQQDQRDLMLHQQAVQAANAASKGAAKRNIKTQGSVTSSLVSTKGAASGKKKGPRTVEYICALCSESYNSTCDYNPWWALVQHECPKCRKTQIPRVDISSPANAIEYHPALLASADDTGGGGNASGAVASTPAVHTPPAPIKPNQVSSTATAAPVESSAQASPPQLSSGFYSDDSDSGSELSDELLLTDASDEDSFLDSDDSDLESFLQSFSPGEQAENESFGFEYTGPKLSEGDAARLLILIDHASTCPGRHKSAPHREVCRSTKFLMLHVRDCPGTTSTFDVCPFPWCRKTKHLLYHLVSCTTPTICSVCSPADLSRNFITLRGLNEHRRAKQKERMMAASLAARGKALSSGVSVAAPYAANSKPYASQNANAMTQAPQRQTPTTSTPKIISTSIKPISGQRPNASLPSGQTSSILHRQKTAIHKIAAKPSAVPPPVNASLITQSVATAPPVPAPASTQVQPIALPVASASAESANQAVGTQAPVKVDGNSAIETADGVVPDSCSSTCKPVVPTAANATAQIEVPGKARENEMHVTNVSANGPLTVSVSPLNSLSDPTPSSKSPALCNGSYPLAKTDVHLAIPESSVTMDFDSVAGGQVLKQDPGLQVASLTELNGCVDVSIPKPQITLPIVDASGEVIAKLTEQDDASPPVAIDEVKASASETVKVGC